MIVSVSRRTDIPAFYSEWFYNRLKVGYLYVMNPFNRKQISRINLTPQTIDCFVFWTKDPEPMLIRLGELKGYSYYFQFTLTAYRNDVEKNVRKKNDIIKTFIDLSNRIGKEKVVWRYDPIFINDYYTEAYHYEWFKKLCAKLQGCTEKCVISFLDLYAKTQHNTKSLKIKILTEQDTRRIAKNLADIGNKFHITLETCSEKIDLSECGIHRSKCIDDKLIQQMIGSKVSVKKDHTQREECGCVKSIDIGQYNTCQHFCAYCYANFNDIQVKQNCEIYDPESPILMYRLHGDEKITERLMPTICERQIEQLTLI